MTMIGNVHEKMNNFSVYTGLNATGPRKFSHNIIRHFMCLMWGKTC